MGGRGGGCWEFKQKKINAKADRKKNLILHCNRKKNYAVTGCQKNIALLNLSSQCIVFMEKYISVPHILTGEGCEKKLRAQ